MRSFASGAAALAVAAVVTAGPAFAENERVLGAVLPEYAHKVAEYRYRTTQDWEGVMKFYKMYDPKQYPRKSIANQPGVKAIHIANPSMKGWEGLNIYQANDEIRIYVVPTDAAGVRKAKKTPPKK